ncbi:peptidase M23 [Bacillus swezeyi]|uniref:Peptidase M23 n=1 Tax=Bacillus swezeyi TaxID=1925020 RepID=A0A5M8RE86_9BACI|nr:peptidase M23 [Bacillus swezeyi]KAA6446917.1 peptidase M23 [Bacillus swezeyi]KAA6471485.1 peptidase M23 [Bacillus swezeyi]
MSVAIRTILFVLLFSYIMTLTTNLDSDKTTTRQLKNSTELAVHDAALALDKARLGEGKIVFNRTEARKNFVASLSYNLKLQESSSDSLTPKSNSFLKDPIRIERLVYIDDNSKDGAESISFPYHYEDPIYNVSEILNGPGIIAIVSTKTPRYMKGEGFTATQASVYEYKR